MAAAVGLARRSHSRAVAMPTLGRLARLVPIALPVALAVLTDRTPARAAPPEGRASALTLTQVDTEPREGRTGGSLAELEQLRADVREHPEDRTKRLALVRSLIVAKDLDGALAEARAWRAKDAYNLVAVRALGDVLMERGEKENAERVYSSIVELLPKDVDAQRALATLLKQRGDLDAAHDRLVEAVSSRPDDARLLFELADVELRLGKTSDAEAHLGKVIAQNDTPEQIRYPAKQRLGQLFGEARRSAKTAGNEAEAKAMGAKIDALHLNGALENDVHVYLTWDTDRTDVDLWVTTPRGEKIFYSHRKGAGGEALYDDVTTGYGPESFTAEHAQPGEYKVEVNYYSAHRGAFPEARGEVVVVLDEGRASEQKQVLPYRLFAEKQTVTVATIRVNRVGGPS
jgi:tetratricopeptide (TPR) repeat protein